MARLRATSRRNSRSSGGCPSASHTSWVNFSRRWRARPAARAFGSKRSQPSEEGLGIEESGEVVTPELAKFVQGAALGSVHGRFGPGCSEKQKIELHLNRRSVAVR